MIGRPVGGCDVLADPALTAREAFVFWRADVLARLVRLTPAPLAAGCLIHFDPDGWGGRQAALLTADGYHLIIAPRPGLAHHLLLPGPEPPAAHAPMAPVPLFDAWHPQRLASTLSFWRYAQNPRITRAPPVPAPRPTGRTLESAFMLWALDLATAGASGREVAAALWGSAPVDWSDSPMRAQVRRVLATGGRLANGGYRALLKR
ncbi:DUF2285 domain-containing protein [Nitrospirillum iridis]|uniref:T6SS Transcription factor RovC-like DNA binding domain-containing protein n=1 Tax=Nitrospirillum iridis TaxID=765888 RepID=A0A7X0B3F3_9PROT|nr:DUF2285 domain-containing protein [Nitrospirillum iridis]MBB6254948.1 hypothetical protein [Nitrospirillum iridis]